MRIPRRAFLKQAALGGAAVAGWPVFRSRAAETGRAGRLRIVYYTDIHARKEWDTPEAMMTAARKMSGEHADLVLCGGDLITDGFQSPAEAVSHRWDVYRDMHETITPHPHAAIGNHDLVAAAPEDGSEPAADPRAVFLREMGLERTYRSFDADGLHIMFLDPFDITGGDMPYRGRVDEAQLAWIRDDLARVDQDTPVIVLCHMPLMTAFYQAVAGATAPAPENRVTINNREVLETFRDHNLLMVLQGHLHVNEMIDWGSTTFTTGGAVCGKWWRGSWHGTPEGYGVLDIANGKVDWSYRTYGWQTRRPDDR